MFERILIANRGEIACRVIRTAHRLGVATVAVHSDADAGALHVALAEEAVRIGPPPAAESYLNATAIIAAARATGAQAIHPGYGFLSENPDFVEAVEAAGLTFIGPSAQAIRAMGLKDAAKALMQEAGVPVVPGYHGARQDDAFLAGVAEEIGYPVLIKAVAGGGGKGMRRVDAPRDFAEALASARAEAKAAFGNASVLIEKFVANPRHIEVQVFGDGARAVHLYERDCSLQRRHQKVIEEAPAPGMTPEMRAAMGAAGVRAAETIGYSGAGTVEFIVDGSGPLNPEKFWFMEMNTRLQVEHPVTEAVTGVDLVEWQLRVAAGEPLPLAQEDIPLRGHAIEVRLYAEDAEKGFLPAIGTLSHLSVPDTIRADLGVRAGDAISPHYDPMIGKLIAHGPDRAAALGRLRAALAGTMAAGTVTNLGFLHRLLADADFAAGRVDTGLIDRQLSALTAPRDPASLAVALAALAACDLPDPARDGFHLWVPLNHRAVLEHRGARIEAVIEQPGPGHFDLTLGEKALTLDAIDRGSEAWQVSCDGHRRRVLVAAVPGRVTVGLDGALFVFAIPDPLAAGVADHAHEDSLTAPMHGLVRRLTVSAGAEVAKGDLLLVLEAMKMEHSLRAPHDGTVTALNVAEGDQVADGDLLLLLEAPDA